MVIYLLRQLIQVAREDLALQNYRQDPGNLEDQPDQPDRQDQVHQEVQLLQEVLEIQGFQRVHAHRVVPFHLQLQRDLGDQLVLEVLANPVVQVHQVNLNKIQ